MNPKRTSPNGRWLLIYQPDGNLVLYDQTRQPPVATWASRTHGTSAGRCAMQPDGNLVVYDASGVVRWNSETNGSPGAWADIQDDGNFVVYAKLAPPQPAENLWDAWSENKGGMVFCLAIYKYTPQGNSQLLERRQIQVKSVPAAHRLAWAAAPHPNYEYKLVKGKC